MPKGTGTISTGGGSIFVAEAIVGNTPGGVVTVAAPVDQGNAAVTYFAPFEVAGLTSIPATALMNPYWTLSSATVGYPQLPGCYDICTAFANQGFGLIRGDSFAITVFNDTPSTAWHMSHSVDGTVLFVGGYTTNVNPQSVKKWFFLLKEAPTMQGTGVMSVYEYSG
jgi:hypothetical protein